jgi:hypothetical protein
MNDRLLLDMATACLASLGILAGGLALIYGLGWYKDRKTKRRIDRSEKEEVDQLPVQTSAVAN